MLKDNFNRVHDYLRISLTDRCNLRCSYCTPSNFENVFFEKKTLMSADEIEYLVSVFVQLGIKKIRLTGGEPLVRKDAKDILMRLSKYPVELAITTNGVFIKEFIDTLKNAGVKSVNVSLDSLKRENYFSITKRDEFNKVVEGIDLLVANNFQVKINVVIIKGTNDNEILSFIEWTKNVPIHVRFIEFMPFQGNKWNREKVFSHKQTLELIATKYKFIKLINEKEDTAKKYFVPQHKGTFAIISSMTEPFCEGCNRLRLTSDGKMFNCLFAKQGTDLLLALRTMKTVEPLIRQCVSKKYFMHGQDIDNKDWSCEKIITNYRSMQSIGG